jgi:hypothetical protein
MKQLFFGFPILVLGLIILFSSFTAMASETFYISNGPGGGWRVSTPLEDYDIVPVSGGAYWVGTEHEYTKAVVFAWAQYHGFRQAHIQGDEGATAVFVPTSSLKAILPATTIDNGTVTIMFNEESKPGTKRVNIYWNQDNNRPVAMILIDTQSRAVYHPYEAFNDQGYYNEDFTIPMLSLKRPLLAMFFTKHSAAVVAIKSLALVAYKQLTENTDGITMQTRQQKTIAYLQRFDPSIAKPTAEPTENTLAEPIEEPTVNPIRSNTVGADLREFRIGQTIDTGNAIFVHVVLTPTQNAYFDGSDFILDVGSETAHHYIVGSDHLTKTFLIAGESRECLLEFPVKNLDTLVHSPRVLRWRYSITPF